MPLTAILAILSSTKKRYWCGASGRPFGCLDVWNLLFVGQGFGFWFEWCLNWSSLITSAIHITSFPFHNQWHFSLRNVITVHGAKGSKWHEMALREAIIHKIKVFFLWNILWTNSTFKTPYPPLPYIFWKLWTCSFTWNRPIYDIPIQKIDGDAIPRPQ